MIQPTPSHCRPGPHGVADTSRNLLPKNGASASGSAVRGPLAWARNLLPMSPDAAPWRCVPQSVADSAKAEPARRCLSVPQSVADSPAQPHQEAHPLSHTPASAICCRWRVDALTPLCIRHAGPQRLVAAPHGMPRHSERCREKDHRRSQDVAHIAAMRCLNGRKPLPSGPVDQLQELVAGDGK